MWAISQGSGEHNASIKGCFSQEQHPMSNERQEAAATRCVGGILKGQFGIK